MLVSSWDFASSSVYVGSAGWTDFLCGKGRWAWASRVRGWMPSQDGGVFSGSWEAVGRGSLPPGQPPTSQGQCALEDPGRSLVCWTVSQSRGEAALRVHLLKQHWGPMDPVRLCVPRAGDPGGVPEGGSISRQVLRSHDGAPDLETVATLPWGPLSLLRSISWWLRAQGHDPRMAGAGPLGGLGGGGQEVRAPPPRLRPGEGEKRAGVTRCNLGSRSCGLWAAGNGPVLWRDD